MKNDLRMTIHPLLDIRRGKRISFQFNGRKINAYEGETIAAALYASGIRIFSRSFKYHRPRGLFCLSGHCSNCLMRVDGVPNVRVCREPVHPGAVVRSQNARPSLNFDLVSLVNYLPILVRPGFQYRRFIRPRWAYHIWEKFLRRMAGIGALADTDPSPPAVRHEVSPEIVVIGGGTAGLSAAIHAAEAGAHIWLVERESTLGGRGRYDTSFLKMLGEHNQIRRFAFSSRMANEVEDLPNCRILKDATAFAWYDEGILAVSQPGIIWEMRPLRAIIATGSYDHPMIFENNDLPGIFSGRAVQSLMHGYFIRPGSRAVVVTIDGSGYILARQLLDAGLSISGIVDDFPETELYLRPRVEDLREKNIPLFAGYTIKTATGWNKVKGIIIEAIDSSGDNKFPQRIKLECDVLCLCGTHTPANELLFQRSCEGVYVLESPHQFTRKSATSSHMRAAADMFVAGEAAGSKGMARAWLEGKVAGLSAALDLGHGDQKTESARNDAVNLLGKE